MSMEEFNKASWEADKECFTEDSNCENVIEWVKNSKVATVAFTQKKYINKVQKLAQKYPDKVQIIAQNKDGSIVAHIPVSAVHLNILTNNLSDEQRKAASDRLKAMREKKKAKS